MPSLPRSQTPVSTTIAFLSGGKRGNAHFGVARARSATALGRTASANTDHSPQYSPYLSNATKWGDLTLQLIWNARGCHLSVRPRFELERRGRAPGARRWRCGRQKSPDQFTPRRTDVVRISPSISSRFPVIPPRRPAHTSPLPTARPRSSAATSRAFPGSAPSSRSISTTKSPTPRAIPDRSRTTLADSNDFYYALIHELGHAIGLGHGGPYNQGDDRTFRRRGPAVRPLRHGVVGDDVLRHPVDDERDVLCRLSGNRDELGQRWYPTDHPDDVGHPGGAAAVRPGDIGPARGRTTISSGSTATSRARSSPTSISPRTRSRSSRSGASGCTTRWISPGGRRRRSSISNPEASAAATASPTISASPSTP